MKDIIVILVGCMMILGSCAGVGYLVVDQSMRLEKKYGKETTCD